MHHVRHPYGSGYNQPIFIVGCDRSGTTMLRLMLMKGREVYIPTETNFIPRMEHRFACYGRFVEIAQQRAFAHDVATAYATYATVALDAFGLTEDEVVDCVARRAPTEFAGAVAALYEMVAARAGTRRWGDKTPTYVLFVDRLAVYFPSALFLHVIRDGRDAVLSGLRLGWFGGDLAQGAIYWKERVEAGRRMGRRLEEGRYLETRYEDLVLRPEAELRRICGWARLTWNPAMLRFHEDAFGNIAPAHQPIFTYLSQPLDPSRIGNWRLDFTDQDRRVFNEVAGPTLRAFCYHWTGTPCPSRKGSRENC